MQGPSGLPDPFPSAQPHTLQALSSSLPAQAEARGKKQQQKEEVGKELELEETNEISSFIPSGQWHR